MTPESVIFARMVGADMTLSSRTIAMGVPMCEPVYSPNFSAAAGSRSNWTLGMPYWSWLRRAVRSSWPEMIAAPTPALLALAASGLVGITVGDTALFAAVVRIGVHRSLLLLTLAPVRRSLEESLALKKVEEE